MKFERSLKGCRRAGQGSKVKSGGDFCRLLDARVGVAQLNFDPSAQTMEPMIRRQVKAAGLAVLTLEEMLCRAPPGVSCLQASGITTYEASHVRCKDC